MINIAIHFVRLGGLLWSLPRALTMSDQFIILSGLNETLTLEHSGNAPL